LLKFDAEFRWHTDPFRYATIDRVIDPEDLRLLNSEVPELRLFKREIKEGAEHRKQYNMWRMSLVEDGRRVAGTDELPPSWRKLLDSFLSPEFKRWATAGTGVDVAPLRLTMGLYRYSERDYSTVDTAKLTKALHWAFYLNEEWTGEDGGALHLWSEKTAPQPSASIIPRGGTSALFAPAENTWHNIGTITADGRRERLTIMVEYWNS
jgi:hypothetical protein